MTSQTPPEDDIKLEGRGPFKELFLSVNHQPRIQQDNPQHILVIGGGVSGLITAWILLDKGFKVTILAEHWAWNNKTQFSLSRLTSQIAGALWEFPPGGCGLTELVHPSLDYAQLEHYEEWSLQSYEFYTKFAKVHDKKYESEFGGTVKPLNQFFYHPLDQAVLSNTKVDVNEADRTKFEKVKNFAKADRINGFKRDRSQLAKLIAKSHIDPSWGKELKDTYTHDAPIINTDIGMAFLMSIVEDKGASLETRKIDGSLTKVGFELQSEYEADGIVNASGLGALTLAEDQDVFPVRGAIKRMANSTEGSFDHVTEALLVPAQKDVKNEHKPVIFLVPRGEQILYVGSIIQRFNDQLTLTNDSPEVVQMWRRARKFLPGLNDAEPYPGYSFAQGLRPFSKKNVKVRAQTVASTNSKEHRLNIVHNYGHGGSGWTLAIGCARTAVFLLEKILDQKTSDVDANKTMYPFPKDF